MDDEALLQSARLYQRDYQSGTQGYTLAAVLLLGNDEVIQSIASQYRTVAILRKIDLEKTTGQNGECKSSPWEWND